MQPFLTDIDKAIEKGISFLGERQFHNGEFCCYISNKDEMKVLENWDWCVPDRSVFPTILIGNSLLFLEARSGVDEMLKKITDFLVAQKRGSVWNHSITNNAFFFGKPDFLFPFDVDDTACASALLKARNISFPSNIDILLSNRNRKKLFYTWFILRGRFNLNKRYWRLIITDFMRHPLMTIGFWKEFRNDIDAVVNANVLYYLGENKETENVIRFLIDIIAEGTEGQCDKWYRNPFTAYYFISRNYNIGIIKLAPVREPIIDRILGAAGTDGSIGKTLLNTALSVCTLLNLRYTGPEIEDGIRFLLTKQHPNGSWERRIFYRGLPFYGWGSEELTTGICLEAMQRYIVLIK